MLNFLYRLFRIIFLLTLTTAIVLLSWKAMLPPPPPISLERLKAADDAAQRFIEDLRLHRGNAHTVVVLHLGNDPSHCLTNAIRRRIRESGVLTLARTSYKEQFMTAYNLQFEGCDNEQEAMRLAEAASQDLLVWGVVKRFETEADGNVVIEGKIDIIDAVSLESVTSCPLTNITADNLKKDDTLISQTASLLPARMATFLLLACLLSSLLFPIVRKIVAKRSPRLNMALLFVLSIIDTTLAALLLGKIEGFPSSFWFMLIVFFLSLICNLMILNHAAKQLA